MNGRDEFSDEELVELVTNTARLYALKLGAHGRTEFWVDRDGKTLTIHEGGNVSGHYAAIVQRDHVTVPFHRQSPLVDDSDQGTARQLPPFPLPAPGYPATAYTGKGEE
jgi:hypothetical protein